MSAAPGSFEGPTDKALAAIGLQPVVRFFVPSFLVLPEILLTDDIIGAVPERLLRNQGNKFRTFELPVGVPGFVVAIWHPLVDELPFHVWIRKRLRDVARHLPRQRKKSVRKYKGKARGR